MNKEWVTSDHHFRHENIIKLAGRPFKNISEMDNELISRWNNVVRKNDILFHLGDFCWLRSQKAIYDLVNKLNGRKRIILGNHDLSISKHQKFWQECGFEEVYRYPIIYKDICILSHAGIYMNEFSMFRNIHGHEHAIRSHIANPYKNMNVCVEHTNYAPILIEELLLKEGN